VTDLRGQHQVTNVELSSAASTAANTEPVALAFLAVFNAHVAYVCQTLRRLGVREADVEDVAHDVFLQVHLQLHQYDASRPLRPWLFAFAFRKASEHRRLARVRLEVVVAADEPPDMAPSALDRALRQEALQLGHQALAEIEFKQRAVFVLHELDGCAMPEVAAVLEIPLNTAYSRLRLARAAFDKAVRRLRLQRGDP
jgi:RNA polymerase sigma-70 factor, ECF subfamily